MERRIRPLLGEPRVILRLESLICGDRGNWSSPGRAVSTLNTCAILEGGGSATSTGAAIRLKAYGASPAYVSLPQMMEAVEDGSTQMSLGVAGLVQNGNAP